MPTSSSLPALSLSSPCPRAARHLSGSGAALHRHDGLLSAVGQCFSRQLPVAGPLSKYVPVDVDIAGRALKPEAIIDGLASQQKFSRKRGSRSNGLSVCKEAISQLFSKPSCAMYPAVPSEAAPNYRGRIVYHADKCIGCGMCERVCAGNAISRTVEKTEEGDKITLTFNLGSCTFCATCADFAPRKAIELTGDYHMIATKEEDLLVTGALSRSRPSRRPLPPPPRSLRPRLLPHLPKLLR